MADSVFYANIDITATSGNGTQNYPFNFNNLYSFLNVSSGAYGPNGIAIRIDDRDTVNIKGTYSADNNIELFAFDSAFDTTDVLLKSWDESLYGPWKLIVSDPSSYSVKLAPSLLAQTHYPHNIYIDGLVTNDCTITPSMNGYSGQVRLIFTNCMFYGDIYYMNATTGNYFGTYIYYDYFLGCSFINSNFSLVDHPTPSPCSAAFYDCVLYNTLFDLTEKTTEGKNDRIYYENCVFNNTSAVAFSATNQTYDEIGLSACTFSWTPLSTFPNISAIGINSKSDLIYENFGLPTRTFSRRNKYYLRDLISSLSLNFNTRGNYNYAVAKYRTPRVGPGAFAFTDYNAFVDFDNITTSGHQGTSGDPFSYIDFWNFTGQNPIIDTNDNFETCSFNPNWDTQFKTKFSINTINGDKCAVRFDYTDFANMLTYLENNFTVEFAVRFGSNYGSYPYAIMYLKSHNVGEIIASLGWYNDELYQNKILFRGYTIPTITVNYTPVAGDLLKLKIEKNGNIYRAYYLNGSTWVKIGEGLNTQLTTNMFIEPSTYGSNLGFSYINVRTSEYDNSIFRVVDGDIFKIKGEVDITNLPGGNKLFIDKQYDLLAWNTSAYGPWRMFDSGNVVSLGGYYLENGIVFTSGDSVSVTTPDLLLYPKRVDNMFIKGTWVSFRDYNFCGRYNSDIVNYCNAEFISSSSPEDIFVRGSTIICEENDVLNYLDFDFRNRRRIVMKDSVVYINRFHPLVGITSTYISAISADIDNVVTNVADSNTLKNTFVFGSYQQRNSQYGWTVPMEWPNWADSKYAFIYTILGQGITLSGTGAW